MHVDDLAIGVLKALGLRGVAKRYLINAPKPIREWAERRKLHNAIRNRRRLICEDELKRTFRESISLLCRKGIEIGDYLEFGVYNGSSLLCMYRVMEELGVTGSRLIGFDSFEGLPAIALTDSGGHWKPGEFKSSHEFTCQVLEHEGVNWERVTLVKGVFSETLTEALRNHLNIRRAGVIMVDCDLYQSAKEALDFCEPGIVDKSVILFDDWFPLANQGLGEKRAFDEFLAAAPYFEAEELFDFDPYGKGFLVSRTSKPASPSGVGR